MLFDFLQARKAYTLQFIVIISMRTPSPPHWKM